MVLMWGAAAAWAAVIFFFSSQQNLGPHLGIWDFGVRKTAHMIEFGFLSLLIWQAIMQHGVNRLYALFSGAFLALLYACSDEFHQSFVPGRNGTIRDVGIDLAGITIAGAVALIMGKRRTSAAAKKI